MELKWFLFQDTIFRVLRLAPLLGVEPGGPSMLATKQSRKEGQGVRPWLLLLPSPPPY